MESSSAGPITGVRVGWKVTVATASAGGGEASDSSPAAITRLVSAYPLHAPELSCARKRSTYLPGSVRAQSRFRVTSDPCESGLGTETAVPLIVSSKTAIPLGEDPCATIAHG